MLYVQYYMSVLYSHLQLPACHYSDTYIFDTVELKTLWMLVHHTYHTRLMFYAFQVQF